jgi:geranylgeranyl diphosphate synthase type I
MMSLQSKNQTYLLEIEAELHRIITFADGIGLDEYRHMLAYHLGWEGEGAGPEAQGKRIRPLLLILVNASAGGDWHCALPAAAAVELLHNFSLIHDDIEDNSPLRHGRPTVWKKWGIAQAVNAGDAMFTLAHLAILRLTEKTSPAITLDAAQILMETCLSLTKGQFLDLYYESQGDLSLDAYWSMVSGKTAALLTACTQLGALIAGVDPVKQTAFSKFGHYLGLAFQVQDDLLGIWGKPALTGKSTDSDLLAGKKTFPVLHGLAQKGAFAERWNQGAIQINEVAALASQLEAEGSRAFTESTAAQLTNQALQYLVEAEPWGEAAEVLHSLTLFLLGRAG